MNKIKSRILLLMFSLLCFAAGAFAQDYGTISGTVKDQNDAVVRGATVKVTNAATGAERTATTNDDGNYLLTNLAPGEYSMSVTATGFQATNSKVQVSVGGSTSANVQLGIQVDVNIVDVPAGTGGLAEVNTTDQTQSNVVTSRQLTSLPTLDRNPYALVTLSGNVSTSDPSGRGAGVAVNGQRAASTNILIDGVENVATFTATISQTVPQDAVSEFRIITSNFSAEFGRASGGIVNVATKSGGNKFEGSVFAQNRNSALASSGYNNNANGNPKAFFNRNQFGGSFSGPIIKNKLFFSDSIEFVRVRSSASVLAWVPTTAFINAAAANTRQFFTTYGNLTATPTGQIDASGNFRMVRYSAPVDAGGGTPENGYNNSARVDWIASDRTSMFFSYKLQSDDFLPGTVTNSPWAGYTAGAKQFNQNFMVSGTHNFSTNLIFDGKFAYRRARGTVSLGSANPNTPTLYWYDQALPSTEGECIALPGYLPCSPGLGLPAPELEQLYDFKPNMTWIKGNHNVRFGGQFVRLNDDTVFGAYQNASEGLSGGSFAQAQANFLSGTTVRHQVAVDPQGKFPGSSVTLPVAAPNFRRTNVYNEWAIYGMDTWRMFPNFTVNLGLRYEFYGVQKSTQGLDSNFYFGPGANIFQRIRSGFAGNSSANGGLWAKDKNNFAPRVGFAWDLTGDGKTSIRGGYGLAYERNFGNVTFNVIQNPPYYAVLSVPGTVTINNFGPLAGGGGSVVLPRTSLRAVDPNIVNAYAHQWGASVERRLTSTTVAKVDYSGSAGRNLYSISNINRTGTGTFYLGSVATTGCNGLAPTDRLNCQYSNINFRGSDGTSNYYSFTPSLESSDLFGTGITMTARYSYAVAKDNLSSTFSESGNNFNLGYLDPFNPMLDYGYADFDVRHRFVSSIIYPIPFNMDNKTAKAIFGGWNVSTIFSIESGTPFTVFDVTNFNVTSTRRVANGGQLVFNGTNVQSGPNRFTYIAINNAPSIGTDALGNNETPPFPNNMSKRNSFRGPGFWNADVSVFKNISISENKRLQFRADFFNVFNHANLFVDIANAYVFDPTFAGGPASGVVDAQKFGSRTGQISARFQF